MNSIEKKNIFGNIPTNKTIKKMVNGQDDLNNENMNGGYPYETIKEIAEFLMSRTKHSPKIGIICGSGLGGLADELVLPDIFPYETIPHFPVATVAGHAGRLVLGLLSGIPVICMQGRFHSYEGYSLWKCSMPVRVMKVMGIKTLIVTNAAGGLNPEFVVGDIMIIKDHVNMMGFAGDSPLRGSNDERFGPRFPAMNNCYDPHLRVIAKETASEMGLKPAVKEGVYIMLGGPCYETVAELRLLRVLGVDAVGMSTVPEVVVARHCGIEVFAFSLITNKCVMDYDTNEIIDHSHVIEAADKRKGELQKLINCLVKRIDKDNQSKVH